jgi:hypothetical protein
VRVDGWLTDALFRFVETGRCKAHEASLGVYAVQGHAARSHSRHVGSDPVTPIIRVSTGRMSLMRVLQTLLLACWLACVQLQLILAAHPSPDIKIHVPSMAMPPVSK